MTDEEKRRAAIAESRALLARLHGERKPEPEPAPASEPEAGFPPIEDAVARWKREADEAAAERKAAKLAMRYAERRELERREAEQRPDWSGIDARIRQAIENERDFQRNILTQVAADLYERIGKLETARSTATGDNAKVIDMPGPFLRRVN